MNVPLKTSESAPLPVTGKARSRAFSFAPFWTLARRWAVLLVVALGGAAGAHAQQALFADPVLARGREFTIKRSEVEEAFLKFKANAAANGQNVPESQREEIEKRILDRLIIVKVLSAKATEADKAEARKKADKFFADTKARASSEDSFKRQLLAMGLTEQEFKADIMERAVVEEVIERELRPKVQVTEAEAKKFYDDNPARFEQPEMVKFQHIHVSTIHPDTRRELPPAEKAKKRELADKTLARARAGEDFAKLVNEVSDDMRTKDRGGEYTVARNTMEPVFAGIESAAFSMKPGQISDVLITAFGYHVIKLVERIPAKQVPFTEVAERVREGLRTQQVQKLLPDYLEQAKKEAGVQLLDAPKQ